ncbi:MAG: single-stranded DNA-binding protein [Magnetococcales bacterium]|nr:single-stranded DNA-binding protein [Magnetococcales bacterium]
MSEPVKSNEPHNNQIILDGVVIQPVEFRFTPSGRAVAQLMIEHISENRQGEHSINRLELHQHVVALGELADQCRDFEPGQGIRVEGSLNQKRWIRDGKVRWGKTELYARTIQPLDLAGKPGD